jgi:anti-anti-sigma factor
MSQPVSVEVRDHLDHAVVTVTGEIEGDSVAMVRRTVDDVCAMYSRMVLDVAGASFPDNLGVREFLRLRERITDRNHSVRIVGMSEALRRRARVPASAEVAQPGAQVPKVNGVLAVETPQQTNEAELIARVADRVRRRFPSYDDEAVARVVTECYHQFDGTRIRDFIPILVEREVTDHFRALGRRTAG